MNLSIIKNILEQRKISIKSFAAKVGMTEHGLHQMIRIGSTTTKTLERIAKELDVDTSIFFETTMVVTEPKSEYAVHDIDIDVWRRINELKAMEGLNQKEFSEEIGVNEKTFSAMMSRKTDPGFEVFRGVARRFPNLNMRWFILGEGEKYVTPGTGLQTGQQKAYCKDCEMFKAVIRQQVEMIEFLKSKVKQQ